MKKSNLVWIGFLGCFSILQAQVPDAAPAASPARGAPSSAPASGGQAGSPGSSPLGKDIPSFNPGTEIVSWNGKNWNINQNRLFQSQFERYLNVEEETTAENLNYQKIIKKILQDLAPGNISPESFDDALRLLPEASNYQIDSHLCDTLSNALYSYWLAKKDRTRIDQANEDLEYQRTILEGQLARDVATTEQRLAAPTAGGKNAAPAPAPSGDLSKTTRMAPHTQRLAQINAQLAANKVKRTISEAQAKIEFQALMVQFFLQRRFQHVLMTTRFYRHMMGDGSTTVQVGAETKELFSKTTGMPMTVGVLDTLANEAMRTVREGVDSYKFLLQKNEMESATKRLAEAFVIGEYMPEIRTLPREQKRKALLFTQKSNQLISALEVKDYTLAESLVKEFNETARDLETSKATAAIETARTVSAMHIIKAQSAAVSGEKETVEVELRAAAEIWPRNPALAAAFKELSEKGNEVQKALLDFDQLLSQHNHQQIWDDKMRYIAATAFDPKRQKLLSKVMDDMQAIETALLKCGEIAKAGNKPGAWENAERVSKQFSDNNKLNKMRAELTTGAADFVHTITIAQQLEEKEQIGSSLAWYLKAKKIYPLSEFAEEGVQRLLKKIMPAS